MSRSTNPYTNSPETLRQPESVLVHRDRVVISAVWNLRPHAPIEADVVSSVPASQEVIDHRARTEAPQVVTDAEEIMRNSAAANELTVERLIETAQNYALGKLNQEHNPLVEEALNNAEKAA